MRAFGVLPVLALLVVALLCTAGEAPLLMHADASEACCGVADCSALAMGFASLALSVIAAPLQLRPVPGHQLVGRPPLSPPPEPTGLRTA
jgi:hypothetical protein